MSEAQYYLGINGVTFNVETPENLYQALDILHTQTMEMELEKGHLTEKQRDECLDVLSTAMGDLDDIFLDKDIINVY